MNEKKQAFLLKSFEAGLDEGIASAAKIISKCSASARKQLQDTKVGKLAVNVDDTIQTFIEDASDPKFLRYTFMAERIKDLILQERPKTFRSLDDSKKIRKLGVGLGYLAGTAVMNSAQQVFLKLALNKLNDSEMTEEEKRLCFSYVADALSVIRGTLLSQVDGKFFIPLRERQLFAELLTNNDWFPEPPKEETPPTTESQSG